MFILISMRGLNCDICNDRVGESDINGSYRKFLGYIEFLYL